MAFVTDRNRPQPIWQPPPTAYRTLATRTPVRKTRRPVNTLSARHCWHGVMVIPAGGGLAAACGMKAVPTIQGSTTGTPKRAPHPVPWNRFWVTQICASCRSTTRGAAPAFMGLTACKCKGGSFSIFGGVSAPPAHRALLLRRPTVIHITSDCCQHLACRDGCVQMATIKRQQSVHHPERSLSNTGGHSGNDEKAKLQEPSWEHP